MVDERGVLMCPDKSCLYNDNDRGSCRRWASGKQVKLVAVMGADWAVTLGRKPVLTCDSRTEAVKA